MSNTQLKINIDQVSLYNSHRLSMSSATQIMKGMIMTLGNLKEPTNDYQKSLYPFLEKNIKTLADNFEDLLYYKTDTERQVIDANLVKELRKPVNSDGKNKQTMRANFGPLLVNLKQRINFVLTRPVPKRYENNKEEGDAFYNLREKCKVYMELVKKTGEDYEKLIEDLRTKNNINMEEVAKRRKEKNEAKRKLYQKKKQSLKTNSEEQHEHNDESNEEHHEHNDESNDKPKMSSAT